LSLEGHLGQIILTQRRVRWKKILQRQISLIPSNLRWEIENELHFSVVHRLMSGINLDHSTDAILNIIQFIGRTGRDRNCLSISDTWPRPENTILNIRNLEWRICSSTNKLNWVLTHQKNGSRLTLSKSWGHCWH